MRRRLLILLETVRGASTSIIIFEKSTEFFKMTKNAGTIFQSTKRMTTFTTHLKME